MGFLFSRPVVKPPPSPSAIELQRYVGSPLTTTMTALRTQGILATPVAVKPDEDYEPNSVQAPTGTLLVVYNCENYYVTRVLYRTQA
jgi:hypothetical protein